MKSPNRYKSTISTGLRELGEYSSKRYALFGATLTGLAFEWSPLNEALLGAVGITTHENVGSGNSILETIAGRIATGAVTGGVSFAEQAIVGSLTALSIHQFPKTFKTWQDSRPENSLDSVSTASSTMTALALGSSMAVVEKSFIDKNANLKSNLSLAVKTSAIVGSCNFLLAGVVSTGLDALEKNGQMDTAHNIANIMKNPLLYIGVFGVAKAIHVIKNKKVIS